MHVSCKLSCLESSGTLWGIMQSQTVRHIMHGESFMVMLGGKCARPSRRPWRS